MCFICLPFGTRLLWPPETPPRNRRPERTYIPPLMPSSGRRMTTSITSFALFSMTPDTYPYNTYKYELNFGSIQCFCRQMKPIFKSIDGVICLAKVWFSTNQVMRTSRSTLIDDFSCPPSTGMFAGKSKTQ